MKIHVPVAQKTSIMPTPYIVALAAIIIIWRFLKQFVTDMPETIQLGRLKQLRKNRVSAIKIIFPVSDV